MSLSMVALAVSLQQLQKSQAEGKGNTAGPAQAVFLFVFNSFFAIGWLGMTWLYPAEIVPLRIPSANECLVYEVSGNNINPDLSYPQGLLLKYFLFPVATGSSTSWL